MRTKDQILKELEEVKRGEQKNEDNLKASVYELYKEISDIEKRIDIIERPFLDKRQKMKKEKDELRLELEGREKVEALKGFKNKIPETEEEVENFFKYKEEVYFNQRIYPRIYISSTPSSSNFSIRAIRDYDTKFYIAFDNKTKKVVGTLRVNPSQHRGDSTSATGFIKKSNITELSRWDVKKPLKIFVEQLERYYSINKRLRGGLNE